MKTIFQIITLMLLVSGVVYAQKHIGGEVQEAALENLAADPTVGNIPGRMYYNTTDKEMRIFDGTTYLRVGDTSGAVLGPGSSTDEGVARYDGATGKLVQDSPVTITDAGVIKGVGAPVDSGDAATKNYVDTLVNGLDWQQSVLDSTLTTAPGSPTTGDRYLIPAAGVTGDWAGNENSIAEWDGSAWQYTAPNDGFAVYDEASGKYNFYSGTAWATLGNAIDHNSTLGKQGGAGGNFYHSDQPINTTDNVVFNLVGFDPADTDTYVHSGFANEVWVNAGNNTTLKVRPTGLLTTGTSYIPTRGFSEADSNTFITSTGADQVNIVAGNNWFNFTTTGLNVTGALTTFGGHISAQSFNVYGNYGIFPSGVYSAKALQDFTDTDTFLWRSSPDVMQFYAGNNNTIQVFNNRMGLNGTLEMQGNDKLIYWYPDADTYIYHPVADQIWFKAGNNETLKILSGGIYVAGVIALQGNISWSNDAGNDTYIYRPAENVVGFVAGGAQKMSVKTTEIDMLAPVGLQVVTAAPGTCTEGNVVYSGGSSKYPCYCDGSGWLKFSDNTACSFAP